MPDAHATGRPFVLGIGGTTRSASSSERALAIALQAAAEHDVDVATFTARELELPMYAPERGEITPPARAFLDAVVRADGVLIASPGYHGSISGLLKNALDYTEELRDHERPYLDGLPVGCIVCAAGWQSGTTTLTTLRSIVHALRGWPTPLGVAINSAIPLFGADGTPTDAAVARQLAIVGQQVAEFAHLRAAVPGTTFQASQA
jgi:FMN reductase